MKSFLLQFTQLWRQLGINQRISIGVAIVGVIFFLNNNRTSEADLQAARDQGTAFIVVTHDEALAARCGRVLRLTTGVLS